MKYELIDLTFSVANATNASVLDVFDADVDVVIDIINYMLERAGNSKQQQPKAQKKTPQVDFWDLV